MLLGKLYFSHIFFSKNFNILKFSGTLPTHELLTQNNLREFRPIVHAIRTGNLGLMEDALAKYEFFFVRTGIYLLGTRLKIFRP